MRPIGPHEYFYLRYVYLSDGENMLEYAIQHLCFTGVLNLHYWKVQAHRNDPHKVVRLYLSRTAKSTPVSAAEAFALDLFPEDKAIHLGELRHIMKEQVIDPKAFKFDQVRKDLMAAGLLRCTYWASTAGRIARRRVKQQLKAFEHDPESMFNSTRKELDERLDELGSNVVLFGNDIRDRLKQVTGRTPDLKAVFSIEKFMEIGSVFDDSNSVGGLSFGGGGFGGGSSGGFGGFGGGGFGGGGAGGSW